MAAKDIYHDDVRSALVKDAWTITDDPFRLRWGKKDYYVDLGAERVIAAEKPERHIAVEIKSFLGPSMVDDMEKALPLDPEASATGSRTFPGDSQKHRHMFDEPLGQLLLEDYDLRLLVFHPKKKEIIRWLP